MTDDEDEIEFLRTMPPRPKLLAVPPWHGGSEVPTREAFEENYEAALERYSRHTAVKEHNARLTREHDEQVQEHIRASAKRDVERRHADIKAQRIAELKARLAVVNAQLAGRDPDAETQPLNDEQMARLEGMTRIPEDAGSLSTAEYAAARQRATKAARLLEMEQRFAADEKRNARR